MPQNDTCNQPSTSGVDTVELGPGVDGAFRAFDAGEKLTPVRGGQGASMLTFRLRVGPKAPQCLGQSTTVFSAFDPADTVASLNVPTVTYEEPSGKRATKTMYLIASNFTFPSRVKVVTTVGANRIEQSFALDDNSNGCGGIVKCRQKCVTECDQCATGASGGAQTALDALDQCLAMYCSTDGGAPDAGSPDAGAACRDAALLDASQCLTVWNTCETAR